MTTGTFDPNRLDFAACIERIQEAITKQQRRLDGRIVTSRDEGMEGLRTALEVTNVPDGFHKWQLPLYFKEPTHLFISVAAPGAKAEEHAHRDGDGIRVIVSGSITYNGQELSAGDWMFVPAGERYGFDVGPMGATMFYCYEC